MSSKSIEVLHELQAVESKLRGLREQLKRRRRILAQQELKVKRFEEELNSKQEEIRQLQVKISELELECKARETEISKLQAQLNVAKSNKEYSSILTQLNTARADNSKLEDQILQMLSEMDEMKKSLSEVEEKKKQAEEELEGKREEFERHRREIEDEIVNVEREAKELEQKIDSKTLEIFKRVADRHEGEVLAEIIRNDPKAQEYTCAGCYMSVPLETVNALLTKPDELQLCNACGRILYVKEETVGSGKKK